MSNEPKHPIPPADATRLAGGAYRTQIVPNRTRVAGAGYQSILATQFGVPSFAGRTERYKIGDRIGGQYEVLAIHHGSMGVVYGTFDHKEQLPRALKTLQERFASKPKMRDLFAEEAATWVRLEKHPFIVRAYLVEKYDSQPYVITEYVRGEEGMGVDLQAWLGHPRLTLKLAVEVALQIAQGMQHAVRKIPGLVHRDLKPANILVDNRARAMVTDFGLVCATEVEAGTPAYMAPEQWRGESLDPRTDIYAYGCILYEMFTGHRIFAAEAVEQWKSEHLTRMPVAPRMLQPDLPDEMEAMVMRCLAKVPGCRPQNWDELVSELAAQFHRLTGQPAVLDFSAYELDVWSYATPAIRCCN
jgi:serine/threonine protein kinase